MRMIEILKTRKQRVVMKTNALLYGSRKGTHTKLENIFFNSSLR